MSRPQLAENIYLSRDEKRVVILDQSQLPGKKVYLEIGEPEEMLDAISTLKVRGAPAIGIFAGYCMYVLAQKICEDMAAKGMLPAEEDPDRSEDYEDAAYGDASYEEREHDDRMRAGEEFFDRLEKYASYLVSSRPTAVNLSCALTRIMSVAAENRNRPVPGLVALIGDEAEAIQQEDIDICRKISEYGLTLVEDGDGILTHCNAGPLATSRYGTALGPILLGADQGMEFHVFADETRPLMQGARLTAYELMRAGVDVTLICDNMVSTVMKNGWVKAVFVGCDRIAANGDTANKIGTSGVAILAKYYNIPFYVLGPGTTIDMECPTADGITIELRGPDEIRDSLFMYPDSNDGEARPLPAAPEDVSCYNPAFDITDHSLITAIVTEKGICYPPFDRSLKEMYGRTE